MDDPISQKMRIVALKLLELTRFLSTNQKNLQLFTLILKGVGVSCDPRLFYVHI